MKIPENVKYCPECQVGVFKQEGATYYTWIEDQLIMVPNFPCWVCDICGHRDWDIGALMNLNVILSPNAGVPNIRRKSLNNSESVSGSVLKEPHRGHKIN